MKSMLSKLGFSASIAMSVGVVLFAAACGSFHGQPEMASGRYTLTEGFDDAPMLEIPIDMDLRCDGETVRMEPWSEISRKGIRYISGEIKDSVFTGSLNAGENGDRLLYRAKLHEGNEMDGQILSGNRQIGHFSISPVKELSGMEKAIDKAISFTGMPETIGKWGREAMLWAGEERREYVLHNLGSSNLSSFLLLSGKIPAEYDFSIDFYNFIQIVSEMSAGVSFIRMSHISKIDWKESANGRASGSFIFKREKAIEGRCLFEALKKDGFWTIDKLGIAKKNSSSFHDALIVFEMK